ncbi:MAG: hypothetical protein ACI4DX_01360 [Oliverpabstia sp.]|nr:hypothetical protein [Oliverpabstia sp.]
MNETLNTLKTRRSVRAYLTEQVKEEQLQQVPEAKPRKENYIYRV